MSNIKLKSFKRKTWLLVFRHSTRKTVSFFTKEEAKLNNEEDKFSIIAKIDETFKYDSKYEFLLDYPETNEYCIWRQSLSPLKDTKDGNSAEGFEPIRLIPNSYTFGGLQLSSVSRSLIDGSTSTICWYYAIGSDGTQFSPSFPCYAGSCKEVNLFVRIHSNAITYKFNAMYSTLIHFIILIIVSK